MSEEGRPGLIGPHRGVGPRRGSFSATGGHVKDSVRAPHDLSARAAREAAAGMTSAADVHSFTGTQPVEQKSRDQAFAEAWTSAGFARVVERAQSFHQKPREKLAAYIEQSKQPKPQRAEEEYERAARIEAEDDAILDREGAAQAGISVEEYRSKIERDAEKMEIAAESQGVVDIEWPEPTGEAEPEYEADDDDDDAMSDAEYVEWL